MLRGRWRNRARGLKRGLIAHLGTLDFVAAAGMIHRLCARCSGCPAPLEHGEAGAAIRKPVSNQRMVWDRVTIVVPGGRVGRQPQPVGHLGGIEALCRIHGQPFGHVLGVLGLGAVLGVGIPPWL